MESSKKVAPCSKCNVEMIALCKRICGNGHPPCAEIKVKNFNSQQHTQLAIAVREVVDAWLSRKEETIIDCRVEVLRKALQQQAGERCKKFMPL